MTPDRGTGGRAGTRALAPWPRLLLAGCALLLLGSDWRTPPPGEGPESIPVRRLDGQGYVAVNDLARILDATKFWRGDVRKLSLRAGAHTIVLTLDNPFVLMDDATLWMGQPVRSKDGELQVPVGLIDSLPGDSTLPHLIVDARRERVIVLPRSGSVGNPRLQATGDVTRLVFPADHPDEAVVVTRGRAHFRLHFGGVFVGTLPDSFEAQSLLRAIRPIAAAGGSAFECVVDPAAAGYRLLQDTDARRVTLELSRAADPGYEAFAPEGPAGERRLRVVVIDPGHGGADPGVSVGEVREKDLTLALARLVRTELELQGIRVVLTRNDDRDPPPLERAELANRAAADLVLSLHFDGYASSQARGATAYCPPASFVAPAREGAAPEAGGEGATQSVPAAAGGPGGRAGSGAAPSRVVLLPWRDVAARHAVQSRALAEAVLSALELRGLGPTRLREVLPHGLLGVNSTGVLLECATLTAPGDLERVTQEDGLRQLARTIAEGVAAYRRNE
jgi:N-acetylmuramoyl-L-alanine amidase